MLAISFIYYRQWLLLIMYDVSNCVAGATQLRMCVAVNVLIIMVHKTNFIESALSNSFHND